MNFIKNKKCVALFGTVILLVAMVFPLQVFATEETTDNPNEVSIPIEVTLEIDGDAPDDNVPFTFVIEPDDENTPEPDKPYATRIGEGPVDFDDISYTEPGEYHYTITERDDGHENYIYDTTTYSVDVNVEYDRNGNLIANYSVYNKAQDEHKEVEILFVNLYDDSIPVSENTTNPSNVTTTAKSSQTTKPATTNKNNKKTTNTTKSSSTPRTGDDTNIFTWMAVLCAVVVVLSGCLRCINAAKKRDE